MTEHARRAELERAFRETDYCVMLADGELVLRVGHYDLDGERRLIATTACRSGWQLITACNPGAEQVSEAANRAHLAQLHATLRDWGGTWQPTLARPRGTRPWPEEPGALIVDADPAWAHALARRFRQRAYVAARLGHPPQLVWVEDA